jgi:hypothetical protein
MREQILREIRRLASANGKPPGRRLFESETGIRESTWYGVYWPRWSDALAEAGLAPNPYNKRLDEGFILSKLADASRHFGRIPVAMELRMYKKVDADFPNEKSMLSAFGGKTNLLRRFGDWARSNPGYEDVAAMIPEPTDSHDAQPKHTPLEGFVYLIRSGRHYKIGRSDELERRVKQIRVALPEAASLVHSIRTDDPAGIEVYWHRRFAERRANGEWFKLTATDVAAFKRRKYQ